MVDPLSEPKAGGAVLGNVVGAESPNESPIRLRHEVPHFQIQNVLSTIQTVALIAPGSPSFMLASSCSQTVPIRLKSRLPVKPGKPGSVRQVLTFFAPLQVVSA